MWHTAYVLVNIDKSIVTLCRLIVVNQLVPNFNVDWRKRIQYQIYV